MFSGLCLVVSSLCSLVFGFCPLAFFLRSLVSFLCSLASSLCPLVSSSFLLVSFSGLCPQISSLCHRSQVLLRGFGVHLRDMCLRKGGKRSLEDFVTISDPRVSILVQEVILSGATSLAGPRWGSLPKQPGLPQTHPGNKTANRRHGRAVIGGNYKTL